MKLQVLMSVMNATDHNIVKNANIRTDAIIINQCDEFKYEEFKYESNEIKFISMAEKGVGLSRNNALMRSSGCILLFVDEDETLVDDYERLILSEFINNPKADMIMFNVPSSNKYNPTYEIKKSHRIHRYNSLRYGATKIAVKSNSIKQANVYFSLLFGGGAKYSSGEDSIFVYDCLRKGLRLHTSTKIIGKVSQKKSTWFNGYDDKYFQDKGIFFWCLSPKFAYVYILQFALMGRGYRSSRSTMKALRMMLRGVSIYRNEK